MCVINSYEYFDVTLFNNFPDSPLTEKNNHLVRVFLVSQPNAFLYVCFFLVNIALKLFMLFQ